MGVFWGTVFGGVVFVAFIILMLISFWLAIALVDIVPRVVEITESTIKLRELGRDQEKIEALDDDYKYKQEDLISIKRKIQKIEREIRKHWDEIVFSVAIPWYAALSIVAGIRALYFASILSKKDEHVEKED